VNDFEPHRRPPLGLFPGQSTPRLNGLSIMSEPPQIPAPDYDDPKEIYAFFGLTYYTAAVLEHGILNLAVALLAKNAPGVTVGDVDRLYESLDKQTLGQVINAAKAKFVFPKDLEADLADALTQRNYLAHRFFVVHDIDLLVPSGRRKMIDELIEILKHLKSVDARMDELWMRAWESFGITKEWIEQKMQEYVAQRREYDA
jgi:hypothetical protein